MARITCLLLLLFCVACERETPAEVPPVNVSELTVDRYVAGIEVGSSGPRGMVIGLGKDAAGRPGYRKVATLENAPTDQDFSDDGGLNEAEATKLLGLIDDQIRQIDASGYAVDRVFLLFSIAYTNANGLAELREKIGQRHPRVEIDQLTPALEATANYYTMMGRIDLDFSEFLLVDIGGSSMILSYFDHPNKPLAQAVSFTFGSRSLLERIDPLSDFTIRRGPDRKRMDELVRELVEVDLKRILRQPEFSQRKKVVLVGGLVYKIIKTLDMPMTGGLIDFSRGSEGEPVYRFMDELMKEGPGLARGPKYRPEELYTSLQMLSIMTGELENQQAVFFFERPSWLPGYLLLKDQRAVTATPQ